MTYEEIKKRLTEVETALQTIGSRNKTTLETSYTGKSISNLTTLKESLQKQLAEKEETMFISTKGGDTKAVQMDRKTAMDLKKDPNITGIDTAKGQSLKELDRLNKNSGIEFDQNETAMIAMETGKALAKALINTGDELARMRVKRIQPMSFDVHVVYKGERNSDDEFSFHIQDNNLHLADFSFDKKLVEVGVAGSGKPIINKDVLTNELMKHFKSLNEELNEINYSTYTEPKHFDICPGAESLRDELIEGGKSPEELGEWTFKHDELFKLEKAVLKSNKADERHVKVANKLRDEIIHLSRDLEIDPGKINYLKGHVKKIEDVANKTDSKGDDVTLMGQDVDETKGAPKGHYFTKSGNLVKGRLTKDARERGARLSDPKDKQRSKVPPVTQYKNEGEGDDHHYIKVPRMEYKAAMTVLNKLAQESRVKMDIVDSDGMGNVIIYFMFKEDDIISGEASSFMYDAVMDLQAYGINVYDHSAELDENVTQKHIDDIEASGNIDIAYNKAMELLKSMIAKNENKKEDEEANQELFAKLARKALADEENVGEGHGGDDLDVGHQDDEPGMLKSTSYEIATYAAKLYKKLAKYDQVDGEVDFPNWWQSKLILAKDYVSKAYHYLDSEEKQPIIDKLALEHAINEGTDLYEGDKFSMKRFAGPNGIALQITAPKLKGGGYEYIQIDGDTVKEFARAAVHVAQEFEDLERQVPVNEKIEDKELPKGKHSVSKLQKVHGMIVDKMKELNDLRKEKGGDHMYQGGSEPGKHSVMDHLKSLTKKKKQVEDALDKAVANVGRGQQLTEVSEDEVDDAIRELRDLVDEIEAKGEEAREVVRMYFKNSLSRLDAYGAFNTMYSANRYDVTLGGFVDRLEEEGYEIEDGEVYTNEGDYKSDAQRKAIYAAKAEKEKKNEAELSKDEKKKLKDMSKSLKKSSKGHAGQAKYIDKLTKEAAPGYKHDCAAKVVHETYGVGICIPEKHTLIKEGNKYVVTHYDVLFKEGKKVVEDIPVEELQIVTQKEHWHKGYKKKKK